MLLFCFLMQSKIKKNNIMDIMINKELFVLQLKTTD